MTRAEFLSYRQFRLDFKLTAQEFNFLSLFFPMNFAGYASLHMIAAKPDVDIQQLKGVLLNRVRKKLAPLSLTFLAHWAQGYSLEPASFAALNNHLRTAYAPIDKSLSSLYNQLYIVIDTTTNRPLLQPDTLVCPRLWDTSGDAYDWLEKQGVNSKFYRIQPVEVLIY